MGCRNKIRIRFLIFVVFCVLLGAGFSVMVKPAQKIQQNMYNNSQSGKCSLSSTWKIGHFSRSVFEQMRNCPFKADSGYLARLLRYICLDGGVHEAFIKCRLDDITFCHAFGTRQPETPQPSLKDVFPHLSLLIVFYAIVSASMITRVVDHVIKAVGRKDVSYLEKYVPVYFKSLLSFIPSSVSSLREKMCKDKDLQLKSGKEYFPVNFKNLLSFIPSSVSSLHEKICKDEDLQSKGGKEYAWMYAPTKQVARGTEYFIFSVLDRVASYRPLSFIIQSANTSYYVSLAEAGFRYPGAGSSVECQNCRNLVEITNFTSPAVEAKYHIEGCSFIKEECHLTPNSILHDIQEVETSNNALNESQAVDSDSASGVKRGASREQAVYHEHLAAISNDNITTQSKSLINEHNLFSQVPNEVSSPLAPLPNNLICPEAADGRRPQFISNGKDICGLAVPLDQQPHQIAASVQQQTNQAEVLHQGQVNETSVKDHQTDEATAPKQLQSLPSSNHEEMGACAAPNDSNHSTTIDSSDFNALLFDSHDFTPEHQNVASVKEDLSSKCKKNPGHYANIPMQQLKLDHIPSNVRTPDFLKFITLIGKLVVRLEVKATSHDRPKSEHNEGTRFGTGMAITNPTENDAPPQQSGKLNILRKYLGKSRGFIYIQTSRHLVFDTIEAQQTTVEFFYDNLNRRGSVIAKGVSVEHSQNLGDFRTILKCRINDLSILEFVKNTEKEYEALSRGFSQRLKEELVKRVFVISYPHGGEKMLSYGEHVMVKYALKIETENGKSKPKLVKINNHTQISQNPSEIRKVLLYTADTCEGSSGAAVVSFSKTKRNNTENIILDLWMHNGVCTKHGLNASSMRELTADDIANHGITEIFRPSVQENLEAEATSAANQVVSCPVFVVLGSPTHPAYAVFRKRLESYPNPFVHVHVPADLADAGFFYAGYDDCVRCFQCGLGLRSWRPGDNIYEEHNRNRPDCQFLQMKLKACGINQSSLRSFDQHGRTQTPAQPQPQTAASSGNENCHQLPNLTMMDEQQPLQPVTQSSQRNSENNINFQPEIMKQTTNRVPNGHQEIAVAMVSGNQDEAPQSMAVTVLEKEQEYLKQLLSCKICLRNPVKDLFLPCGELVACLDCSKLLTHCPSCGKKILATVTTFFS